MEKRNVKITVRVSQRQDAKFKNMALISGRSQSQLFRDFINGNVICQQEPVFHREAITAINRIGTNINQIAEKVNKRYPFSQKDMDNLLGDFAEVSKIVRGAIGDYKNHIKALQRQANDKLRKQS